MTYEKNKWSTYIWDPTKTREENWIEAAKVDAALTQEKMENIEQGIEGAHNKNKELEDNVESLSAQLAQTEEQFHSIEHANSEKPLRLINYLGNTQNIHPKVLYFPDKWNGFHYWMAYTPYPFGATQHENPCIAVSNDMINWTVPEGHENPLASAPEGDYGYNNDTHLLYREDTDTLECWWRVAQSGASIHRRTTKDGVNWTPQERINFTNTSEENRILSPSVIFEDGKYKMWYCRTASTMSVRYWESDDSTGGTFGGNPTVLNIDWGELSPWHMDLIRTDLGLEMVVTCYEPGGNNNTADLYYVVQKNDGTFTKPKRIIKRSDNPSAIDHVAIYRSSILKIDGKYYIFYSSIGQDRTRSMALSAGASVFGLNGYHDLTEQRERVVELTDDVDLTDYNVENVDVIMLSGSNNTINSFSGGYPGKRISVVLNSGTATAKFKSSSHLQMPYLEDYTLDFKQVSMDLICTRGGRVNIWKSMVYDLPKPSAGTIRYTTSQTLTDYDVTDIDVILVSSNATLTVNSFKGGYVGKKINIVMESSNASAELINGSRLVLPNSTDYTLTNSQVGITVICTNTSNNTWRAFI